MILREATLKDTAMLAKLGRESFCATFEHLYSEKDLNDFLLQMYSEEAVAQEIEAPEYTHRLAFDGDHLLGFCKVCSPWSYAEKSDARNPLALGQLYTDPARTGEGIGAKLMDWAIDYGREHGHDAIQLSVYAENFGAQRFYQRYGFKKIADITFEVGEQIDPEFLYELKLDGSA